MSTHSRRLLWLSLGLLGTSCATTDSAAQGGAKFHDAAPVVTTLPPESLFGVCWPAESTGSVDLVFSPADVHFDVHDGATNSTARCLREIATTVVWSPRPSKQLTIRPSSTPVPGFVVLAWVKLLSSARYGTERGLVDPAPLARACLTLGAPRPSTRFEISGAEVKTIPLALTDSERCLEAVLAATAWPSTRAFVLTFDDSSAAPPASGDVSFYATAKSSSTGALEATATHQALTLKQAPVSACWDEARTRRAGLGGSKTFRFRVAKGSVTDAWVTANGTDLNPPAADYRFDGCLAAVVKSTRFAGDGDGVFTWVFASVSR